MNNFLATLVGYFNGLLAVIFIIASTLIGHDFGFTIVGLLIGFLLSISICGIIAIFIAIRNELISIKNILDDDFYNQNKNFHDNKF